MYHSIHVEVRQKLARVGSLLLLCEFYRSSPGYEACNKYLLSLEGPLQVGLSWRYLGHEKNFPPTELK